jgi:hypothetical protein
MVMELMIEGGHWLAPAISKEANDVRDTIYSMLDTAAKGEF